MSGARVKRTAVIDPTGRYRWRLDREWEPGRGRVLWVMLNPSTADGEQDDPTIRKCIGFARRWGLGALTVCNVAPHRATNPRDMERMVYEDGQDGRDWQYPNRPWIEGALDGSALVVCAWGAGVATCDLEEQALDLTYWLQTFRTIHCLGRTAAGFPRHPLMLTYQAPLEIFAAMHRRVAP